MGYQIIYDEINRPPESKEQARRNFPAMVGCVFLVFCLVVNGLWPEGREVLRQILVPWDNEVTAMAAEGFVRSMREGDNLIDAAAVFCGEILNHAESGN